MNVIIQRFLITIGVISFIYLTGFISGCSFGKSKKRDSSAEVEVLHVRDLIGTNSIVSNTGDPFLDFLDSLD